MNDAAALPASSSQLQAIVSKMAFALSYVEEAIVWTDAQGRIQWCNVAFEQLVDQPAAAMAEQLLTQVLPLTLEGNAVPLCLHPVSCALETRQHQPGQYGFHQRDRSVRLSITVAPLPHAEDAHAEDGSVAGVMLVIRDLTTQLVPARSLQKTNLEREETVRIRQRTEVERQQTETALQNSEERFWTVFDTTAIGTAVVSLQGTFWQVNAAYCQLLGYTEAELLTRTFQQLTYPADLDSDLELLQKLVAGEISCFYLEKRYWHKEGRLVWGLLSVSLVRDSQHQPLYCISQVQDISDRKQAEANLRESETRLRLALEAAQMSTWDWDILSNKALYAGYLDPDFRLPSDWQNFAYESFFSQVHPDDQDYVRQALTCALEGEAYNVEFRVTPSKEIQRWVCSKGKAYFNQEGEPVRMLGVIRDITDRKQVELARQQLNQELEQRVQHRTAQLKQTNQQLQAAIVAHEQTEANLRKSEERFRKIFDNAPLAISLADVQTHKFIEINQAHYELFGFSHAEITALTHIDITHPDDVGKNLDQIQQLLDGTIARFQIEKRFLKQNGAWLWATLTVALIHDPDGHAYTLGMLEDITDRKRAEEALQLTQFSIDRATDPIWWVEPDGTIYYVNDAACRDLGYTRNIILGKRVSDFNPDLPAEAWADHWDMIKEKGSYTFEAPIRAKDGTILLTEVTANYIELNGKEYHCSFVRNITDRKQAEDRLKASLIEKEVLLKEVHHRVKNNLQTVCSLLNLQASAIQDPNVLAPFTDSQRRIKAMALVHERLYHSESLAKVNFSDYVHHLATDLIQSYSTDANKIRLNLEMVQLELAVSAAIPCGLIINELVTNALKYAFPDDRTGEIQICFSLSSANQYRLIVADDGVGVPASITSHKQMSPPDSLGLQLVHAFVHQLRGTIELDSSRGSRFELSFPNPT